MDKKKLNKDRLKRTVPAYVFNETQKAIINEHIPYKLTSAIIGGKQIACIEFQEDAFDILDDIDGYELVEVNQPSAEMRNMAIRISTLSFQSIREIQYVSGNSLMDIANGIRVIARIAALAVLTGLANIDANQARRLLPLVRTI